MRPVPPPAESPQPTLVEVTDTPSGVHRVMTTVVDDVTKMKRTSRIKMYSALGGVVLTAMGGGKLAVAKGESDEVKRARLEERQVKVEEKVSELKLRVDAGEVAQRRVELKVNRLEVLLELELDQHGVPKSKRPPKVEDDKGD